MANKRLDLKGKRFGMLTGVRPAGSNDRGGIIWEFQCDCGNTVQRLGMIMSRMKGYSSCGCTPYLQTHGLSKTFKKLHWVWTAMRQRCSNTNCKDYDNYGGRGISVCEAWQDFSTFHAWAIDSGYREGLTIERVDVNGNYEPSNCCWILNERQSLNTRKIRRFPYKGEMKTIRELSEIAGVKFTTMKARLTYYGWSVERAMGDE